MLPKNLASLPVTAHPNKNIFLNNLPFWKEVVNFFPPLCFILLVDILVLLCVFNDPTLVEVVMCAHTVKWSCQLVNIKSSIIFWTDSIFFYLTNKIWSNKFFNLNFYIKYFVCFRQKLKTGRRYCTFRETIQMSVRECSLIVKVYNR